MNERKDMEKQTISTEKEEEEEEEEEEAEGRDRHRVPGIRDKVRSRHVRASGPKSRQALVVRLIKLENLDTETQSK